MQNFGNVIPTPALAGLHSALAAWRVKCIELRFYHRMSKAHIAAIIAHDDICEITGPSAQNEKGAVR